MLYEWDWEDDGTFDYASATSANATHTYALGNYRAKLRVTDDKRAIGLAVVHLSIMIKSVYMATTGNDMNDGSAASPVATLTRAYQIAQAAGQIEVLVEEGTYASVPAFQSGIAVLGGRTLPSWSEGAGHSQFNSVDTRATAHDITTATLVRRVAVNMTLPPSGANAIALYSLGSDMDLRFEECWFQVANAAEGSAGAAGAAGASGSNGGPGGGGSCNGMFGFGGGGGSGFCQGGLGGRGGMAGESRGGEGTRGGCGISGGLEGEGGFGAPTGTPGFNGHAGPSGGPGAPGVAASNAGTIVADEWVPNASGGGMQGQPGWGGGGAGGGGGQVGVMNPGGGNGGGGGGGGAFGGGGGGGGHGGFASFCVMLVNSSPTFVQCEFRRGAGGTGGNGAPGGAGGTGGAGGAGGMVCLAEVGAGGTGGPGGAGGSGGGGAGGPGGPSYGIFNAGASAPVVSGCTFVGGAPGAGGLGASGAPNGAEGLFGTIN
jgi:hypothetical protein